MDTLLKELKEISKTLSIKLQYKESITLEDISNIKITLINKGEDLICKINNKYSDMKIDDRNDYKLRIDSEKGSFKNNKISIENLEHKLKLAILDMNKLNKIDVKKEPFINNHNIRYDNANNVMSDEIKVTYETNNNVNIGIQELKKQQGQMLENIKNTEVIEQDLTLHDQFLGLTKNSALYNKVKLFFIVFMFFLGDLLMLYLKLK